MAVHEDLDVGQLVSQLRALARTLEEVESYTGDVPYDDGYESGCFRGADELETLLRAHGLWDSK